MYGIKRALATNPGTSCDVVTSAKANRYQRMSGYPHVASNEPFPQAVAKLLALSSVSADV